MVMEPSAVLPPIPLSVSLQPGFRLVLEVDVQGVRISFGQTPIAPDLPTAAETGLRDLPPQADQFKEGGGRKARLEPPKSGLEAATRVAEERGEDALLKLEEWDELLPRCVVRREIKRALGTHRLASKTKGKGRDGRARMISARDMVRYFTDEANGR